MAQSPTISRAKFTDGVAWLTGGAELLARGGRAMVPVAVVLLAISLLQLIPVLGVLALILISPMLTAGMLNAFRVAGQGETPQVRHVLAGFADGRARHGLLLLGLVLLIGLASALAVLAAWLAPQIDTDALMRLLEDPEATSGNQQQLRSLFEGVNWFGGLAISALLVALVLAAMYFGVPLVFFWGWPSLVAMLWSVRALLVNWLAFVGFGVAAIGVMLIAGLVFGMLSGLLTLALGPLGAVASQLLSMLLSLFLQLLIAAAQWLAFVQIFPGGSGSGNRGGSGTDDSGDDSVEV